MHTASATRQPSHYRQSCANCICKYLQIPASQSETERERNCDKLELIVRRHVRAAAAGNDRARETLFDRLWGKSAATEGHEYDALSDAELIQRAETVRLKLL